MGFGASFSTPSFSGEGDGRPKNYLCDCEDFLAIQKGSFLIGGNQGQDEEAFDNLRMYIFRSGLKDEAKR